mgnify:CR=1 FL=1|tara:strand:- start:74 stop:637 length:564 start_codon:yes stop_codon:yes gene_type:complete
MLSYTEIKPGSLVVLEGDPFEVVATSGVVKKQRQKPHNTAKMKNLRSGSTIEKTFTQSDKIVEATMATKEIQFVYAHRGAAVFCDPDNVKNRFTLREDVVGEKLHYIREKDIVDARIFEDDIIDIRIPIKVELEVTEAPPNIRGNTSSGGNKVVVTETGLSVTTPLFIEAGDIIRVNTETGEYVDRR